MRTKAFWEFAEQRAANYYDGVLVGGSGRGYLKSDVTTKDFRIEVKSTVKDSISFNLSWIPKIIKEAYLYKQHPAFYILFGDYKGIAIFPVEEINTEEPILHLSGKSRKLTYEKLSSYGYILFDYSVLEGLTKNCMYTLWKIEGD